MTTKKKMSNRLYEAKLRELQIELVNLQEWVKAKGLRVVVIFEGRDAAGKGGIIKRITETLSPRICRVVALGVPTEKEKTQWYFQRYVAHLPAAGEMVLFDRSWYNRAGVEKVMGFCSNEEYDDFLRSCPSFENMLIRSGIILIKYWFSVSDQEQERRFQSRIDDPTRRWKISPMDLESRTHWVEYSKAKDAMFSYTDTKTSPWYVVDSDNKKHARINCISHLLAMIPYGIVEHPQISLPPRVDSKAYVRPPVEEQTFVSDVASRFAEMAEGDEEERKKEKKKKKKEKKAKKAALAVAQGEAKAEPAEEAKVEKKKPTKKAPPKMKA